MRHMVSVVRGGQLIPLPSPGWDGYKGEVETKVDGAFNVEGNFVGDVIREDRGKVEMQFKYISRQDWAFMCGLFTSSRGGSFVNLVEFFAQDVGDWVRREMYVSNRNAGTAHTRDTGLRDMPPLGYKGARIALIGV